MMTLNNHDDIEAAKTHTPIPQAGEAQLIDAKPTILRAQIMASAIALLILIIVFYVVGHILWGW